MTATRASYVAERAEVADACRVLVARGLVDGLLGHVSLRVADDRLLVRCRGPREHGLAATTPDDVRLLTLDGAEGAAGELADGYTAPTELPLHTEVLRVRAEVQSVVHAHPEAVVALDLAGHAIVAMCGAYDIPGASLAAGGVPVFGRGVLVRDRQTAAQMIAAMGDRPVVVLRGHGLTSTGGSVREAVLRAISVDRLARLALRVLSAGGNPVALPDADLAALPDLGATLNHDAAWRHELARVSSLPGDRRTGDLD